MKLIVVLLLLITSQHSFAQKKNLKIVYVLWRDTITIENSIHIMDWDGRNERSIIDYPGSSWMAMANNSKIWFQLTKDTAGKKAGLYVYDVKNKKEKWLFEASGLYQDIDYDRKSKLYAGGFSHKPKDSTKSQYDIFLFSDDGLYKKQITNDTAIDLEPVFSANGNQIIFRSNRDRNPKSWGEFEIYSINTDGTGLKRLTFNPDTTHNVLRASSPTITPDNRIAFSGYWDGTYRLMIMNMDGSNIKPLVKMDDMEQTSCSFSPDGKQIAFTGRKKGMRNNNIYLINNDGTGIRQLTDDWRRKVQPFFIKLNKF